MENSMESPQKLKNRTTVWSNYPTAGYLAKEYENTYLKKICTYVFIIALFAIIKIWK